jgi:predicted O-methyltransferase YrrM
MTITRAEYEAAFQREAARTYPLIDAYEQQVGYALAPERYLPAAEVLCCPLKRDKQGRERQVALWQHGRVLYALARNHFTYGRCLYPIVTLDIGTAKGYSALCVQWALDDSECVGTVHTVDVLDPAVPVARHTVAELDGLKPLADILAPWPEAQRIRFEHSTGIQWLQRYEGRLPFVYVDGKHTTPVVREEAALIRERQRAGDLTVFDDVQLPAVALALQRLDGYTVEYLDLRPHAQRCYAIARRR